MHGSSVCNVPVFPYFVLGQIKLWFAGVVWNCELIRCLPCRCYLLCVSYAWQKTKWRQHPRLNVWCVESVWRTFQLYNISLQICYKECALTVTGKHNFTLIIITLTIKFVSKLTKHFECLWIHRYIWLLLASFDIDTMKQNLNPAAYIIINFVDVGNIRIWLLMWNGSSDIQISGKCFSWVSSHLHANSSMISSDTTENGKKLFT